MGVEVFLQRYVADILCPVNIGTHVSDSYIEFVQKLILVIINAECVFAVAVQTQLHKAVVLFLQMVNQRIQMTCLDVVIITKEPYVFGCGFSEAL